MERLHTTQNSCTSTGPFINPIAEYNHSEGVSVTGGYAYHGDNIPGLTGVYIFGDFGSGTPWGLFPDAHSQYQRTLKTSNPNISTFGERNSGKQYVVNFADMLCQIVPATGTNAQAAYSDSEPADSWV